MSEKVKSIVFAWSSLPYYAQSSLIELKEFGVQITVVSNKGNARTVRLGNLEVIRIDGGDQKISWAKIGLAVPDIFFQGGYGHKAFRRLGKECLDHGRKVVMMNDSCWYPTLRQRYIDPIRHKLVISRTCHALFVPGVGGRKYAVEMGYEGTHLIRDNLYSASPKIFNVKKPINERDKNFIFVGRFEKIKNIELLVSAFIKFSKSNPDWKLHLVGEGTLKSRLPSHRSLVNHDFADAVVLAKLFNESRVLILPSLYEPWGVVVHEATLCGCLLGLSNSVGSLRDLSSSKNCITFESRSEDQIVTMMKEFSKWGANEWDVGSLESVRLSKRFSPDGFRDSVLQIINELQIA